jgi:uncharacterized membrane protein (DUF485 family)
MTLAQILGYIVFGVGMVAIIAALTAIYVLRAKAIARKWARRAEQENRPRVP